MKTINIKGTKTLLILEFPNLSIKKADRNAIAENMTSITGYNCIVFDKECKLTIVKEQENENS